MLGKSYVTTDLFIISLKEARLSLFCFVFSFVRNSSPSVSKGLSKVFFVHWIHFFTHFSPVLVPNNFQRNVFVKHLSTGL